MAKFQVTVRCPVHDKPVYLIVDAVSMEEAKRKAIGRIIPCLPPDTKILTPKGFRKAKDIQLGNIIWGKNSFNKVEEIFVREYGGDLICIKPCYFPEFRVTAKHPILTAEKKKQFWILLEKRKVNRILLGKLKFKQAKQLKQTDYLVLPHLDEEKPRIYYGRFLLTKNLVKLFAWYLSEGHIGGNRRVYISLGKGEREAINEVKSLVKKLGFKPYVAEKRTSLCIHFASKELIDLLPNLLGRGAKNKHLPEDFMLWSGRLIDVFLSTLIKGDGHIREERVIKRKRADRPRPYYLGVYGKEYIYSTRSKRLALEVQILLWKTNRVGGYSENFRKERQLEGRILPPGTDYVVSWIESKTTRARRKEGFWLIPIRRIRKTHYNGPVYNFRTADSSICTPFITHNCPWGPADEREHTFEVKEVLAVTHYPWEPPTTISTAPVPSPAYYVPHPPSETLYVIDPEVADRQLRKLRWWERE